MVITSDALQNYDINIPILTHSSNNTNIINHDHSCNAVDCLFNPISRCTVCLEYYCYLHVNGHAHSLDNFEILK